jgi:ATP/maltotriose-dependent transcriptional regulator MalT
VAAHRGDTVVAARDAAEALRLAEANEDAYVGSLIRALLGFIGLSRGDLHAAQPHLEAAATYAVKVGSVQPGMIPCLPDLVEVHVRLANLDEARRVLAILEGQADRCGEAWVRGTALRARALVEAASGDVDVAQRAAEASVAELEGCPQPFETARSWLVLGQVRRRAKQKLPARVALERACRMFADLGAPLWLEWAEAELRRIGGRPTTRFELTETETQVASLVARGMTNQEVADALFVSVATVQASLKRVYSKLGVRSRTELAIRFGRPNVTDS